MKISRVQRLRPPQPPMFDEIAIGDVFTRADVAEPKTVYMKINMSEAFDMQYPRTRVFDCETRVEVRCAELIVGSVEK
jgi:hypothetical protein